MPDSDSKTDRHTRTARRGSTIAGLLVCLALSTPAGAGSGWLDPCRDADVERAAQILDLYQARDMEMIWITRTGMSAAGERLIDGLQTAAHDTGPDQPIVARIEQMKLNRERLLAHEPEGAGMLVRVNIPDFRVELHQRNRIVYATRAIVGRPDRQTPVLENRITHLTLNPAWNVPQTIAREDLAPRFAQDPDYAERHGYELSTADRDISDIDWTNPPSVALRQRPGPTNALGQIKFEMPNKRAIFLHDTPQRYLFHTEQRAYSAGCVRVEEPLELASRLAGYGPGGVEHLATIIRDGGTHAVRFGRSVPVQLVYFTAWADEHGRAHFRADLYGKDE